MLAVLSVCFWRLVLVILLLEAVYAVWLLEQPKGAYDMIVLHPRLNWLFNDILYATGLLYGMLVWHTMLVSTPCPEVYLRFGEMTFGWVIMALHVRSGHLYGAMTGKSFYPLSGPQQRLAPRTI